MLLSRHQLIGAAWLALSAAVAAPLSAQLDIDLKAGANKWGYAGTHCAATQPWNGAPVTLTAALELPSGGKPGFLPRESWLGFFLEDARHKHRYAVGLFNPTWDPSPASVPYAAVVYTRGGRFQVVRSEERFDCSRRTFFLRLKWADGRLVLSDSADGKTFADRLTLTAPEGFSPSCLGVTVDSFHAANAVNRFRVNDFRVEGNGPARSDRFDGSSPLDWTCRDDRRAVFSLPLRLRLGWVPNAETSDVFDLGGEAVLGFRFETTMLAGRRAALHARCEDYDGRLLHEEKRTVVLARCGEDRIVVPAAALKKNGVYRLILTLTPDGGAPVVARQQFAVIPSRTVTAGQFDPASPYSANYFADWHLAARIGIRKLRQTYWNPDEFESKGYAVRARRYGLLINGPFLGASVRPETPQAVTAKAGQIAAMFVALQRRYPDFIYCQEIYNEPENWPPSSLNTDLVPFAALVARVRGLVRQAGSPLRIMGTGTTHCNLSFLRKVAVIGGVDAVDIVAIHGYRSPNRPEFGHEEDMAAIRALYGPDKPVYVNEDAYFARSGAEEGGAAPSITLPVHTMIELDELTQGIYIQRKFLCQLAAGFALVNQFDSIRNHSLSPDRFYRRPGLVHYAALTWLLPHPVFAGRRTAATDHLWVTDWKSDGRPVTLLWSLNDFHRVTLTASEPLTVYDCFANPIASGREVEVTVGGAPLFVTGGRAELKSRRVVAAGQFRPAVVLPEEEPLSQRPLAAEVRGRALSVTRAEIVITVKNNSGRDFSGTLTPRFMNGAPAAWRFTPASRPVRLASGATAEFSFEPGSSAKDAPFRPTAPVPGQGYAALWWTEGYRVAAELHGDGVAAATTIPSQRPLCLRGVPKSDRIVIDGDPSDWRGIPDFPPLGGKKRNVALSKFWTGKADFSPSFRFAWNRQGLMFLAEVIDDKLDATEKGLDAWRTDSVQIGLNARHLRPDFTDYQVITLAAGNAAAVLQRATSRLPAGPLPSVQFKTSRREGDGTHLGLTVYECLIPWELLEIKAAPLTTFGFSVLFNESDGWWRKGWEGYFMPMGGHMVDPRGFGDLTLVE